ncbi:MAG: transposase [Saprospiraceae bacterium]|nr:transposase [Saprospiraceae bacterium]
MDIYKLMNPIKVLDSDKPGSTHQGYQWVYRSPERRLVLFDYRKGRGMHGPKEALENYNGWLQCDGLAYMIKLQHWKESKLQGVWHMPEGIIMRH